MPALNEERNIAAVLQAIPSFVDQIIVIDDGSVDKTAEIAKSMQAKVISHRSNKGVGMAFRTGVIAFLKSNYDIMINMDSDGQFNPVDIEKLVTPIAEEEADFVTASRFYDKNLYPKMTKAKFYGNKFMAQFISTLTKQKFYDVSCGFRAYSREALEQMNLFGEFTYTQESFIDLSFKKLTLLEIPIKVRGQREFGKSRVASNLFKYGYQTFKIIIRTYRDYKPFALFGFFALILFVIGFGLLGFLGIHYIRNHAFTPHKWAGFSGGALVVTAIIFFLIGFILDMFARMRMNQEQILYHLRKQENNNALGNDKG